MSATQQAAVVTGLIQQAVEELHQLATYGMSSSASVRHAKALDEIRLALHRARGNMAALAFVLGKENT